MIKAFPLQSHERFNISHTDNVTLLFEKKKPEWGKEKKGRRRGPNWWSNTHQVLNSCFCLVCVCVSEFLHMHLLCLCVQHERLSVCVCTCSISINAGQEVFKDLKRFYSRPRLSYWPQGHVRTGQHTSCIIEMKAKIHTHTITHVHTLTPGRDF